MLDDYKQRQIIAILAIGGSRTLAAQFIGCHPRTIYNTARGDAKFAEDLNRAESCPEYHMLKTIADSGRHVAHVAKWGLERMYPDRYRPRAPGTFSVDAVKQLLVALAGRLAEQATDDEQRKNILNAIAEVGKEVIVNTQPFVEQAMTLISELENLGEEKCDSDSTEPATPPSVVEPALLPAIEEQRHVD